MNVPDELRQFRLLHRDFLFRMVDLELLSAHGDIQKLLGQFGALLGAFSFVLTIVSVPPFALSKLPTERLAIAAWGTEEFLIATSMAVVGIFAVFAWNAVLPDRRDTLILGPLPLRARTVFLAKVAAMLTGLGISVVAVNFFTGATFPYAVGGAGAAGAYWVTMAAGGLFVFCALLAIQGLAAQIFTHSAFLRVSAFLQLIAFFVILSLYFLTPSLGTVQGLSAPENQRLLAWLPSFWFLGLFQELKGYAHPVFAPLAARALRNLSIAFATASVTYALSYYRQLRRIVEQPDISPGDRSRPASRLGTFVVRLLHAKPLDRALLLFTARTLARSRQHRFLLAAYGGVGLAIALAYAKDLIYGRSRMGWNHVTFQGLIVSLVLLVFGVVGARAVFALPIALRANWIFRITAIHSPAAYYAAVRKSLVELTAVPICAVSAAAYLAIWPGPAALAHVAVLAATGVLLVDLALHQFRKIPFACSYLPGSANLNVKLGIYLLMLVVGVSAATGVEFLALQRPLRFTIFFAALLVTARWAWRRRSEFAQAPESQLQFEAVPVLDVTLLDLHADAAPIRDHAYIDIAEASR